MVLVQELTGIKNSIKTCLELSGAFMASMTKAISRYIVTVQLIFNQYNRTPSLKQTTRERRNSSTGRTSYTCKYSTPIRMFLKVFLSESKTKDSLTLYLAQKTLDYFRSSHKTVVVSTRDGVTTNKTYKNASHICTSQEETTQF